MAQDLRSIGGQLTLYPPTKSDGSLNLVSGVRAINSRLLHILLMRQGEDPLNPGLGFAPDLFAPKSSRDPQLYRYNLKQLIQDWNYAYRIGLESFVVNIIDEPQTNNIEVQIRYIPLNSRTQQMLSFGFWEYVEAFIGNNLSDYLDTVRFN